MIPEQLLYSLVYDIGSGSVRSFREDRACQRAVEKAAESTAAEYDGISKTDLLDVFNAELDEDALQTIDASAARSDLSQAFGYEGSGESL